MTPAVDAHMHVYPLASWGRRRKSDHTITEYGPGTPRAVSLRDGDVPSVLVALDAAGVDFALALNLIEPARVHDDVEDLAVAGLVRPGIGPARYLRWLNDWLCETIAEVPRFRPVVAIDPVVLDGLNIAVVLASWAQRGAAAVKLHHPAQGFGVGDPRLHPVFEACADLGLPVIVHTGSALPPVAFASTLAAWPDVRFVLAHAGGASWRTLVGAVGELPNAFIDLAEIVSWSGCADGAPAHGALAALIAEIGATRTLFGSDFPWYEPSAGVELVRGLGLPFDDESAVLGGTAAQLFAFPSTSPAAAGSQGGTA